MIFLAWMMFSKFLYPSFKGINLRSTRSLTKFLVTVFGVIITVLNYEWMPFVLFLSYLLYGFLRPFLSRKIQQEIEDDEDDESSKLNDEKKPGN